MITELLLFLVKYFQYHHTMALSATHNPTIFLLSRDCTMYVQYFAAHPGESYFPSPAIAMSLPSSRSSFNSSTANFCDKHQPIQHTFSKSSDCNLKKKVLPKQAIFI